MGGIGGQIMGDTASEPGARGVLLSVPLGILAAVYLLGFAKVDVDDRGEVLPRGGSTGFRGLYLATREALTGHDVSPKQDLGVTAIGPFWIAMTVIPLLVVLGVFFIFRFRRAQSLYWTATVGMLLIAASVLLLGQAPYIGSMAALTWASFQIRRAELPGKMAEREAARAARAEAAADADEDEDEDEYDEDEYVEEDVAEDEYYDEEEPGEDADDDETEYDEDDYEEDDEPESDEYEEEAEYESDEYEEDDEPESDDTDDIDDTDESTSAEDEPEPELDYDEDVLKELEAEIDESERKGGGTEPDAR